MPHCVWRNWQRDEEVCRLKGEATYHRHCKEGAEEKATRFMRAKNEALAQVQKLQQALDAKQPEGVDKLTQTDLTGAIIDIRDRHLADHERSAIQKTPEMEAYDRLIWPKPMER